MPAASRALCVDIAFVFDNLPDWQQLAAAAQQAGLEVAVLSGAQDGLAQMADYLQGRSGVEAIHLLSHGAQGLVQAGSTWLSSANLAEHREALQSVGAALKPGGDWLLYGCDVGQGEVGQAFIEQLAAITGADVAASADATGAAALGGNWALEVRSGVIEAAGGGAVRFLPAALQGADWQQLLGYAAFTGTRSYAEGTDVDAYTSAVDGLGQPTRNFFLLNGAGTYTFTGAVESGGASDGTDVIPIELPTGYSINYFAFAANGVLPGGSLVIEKTSGSDPAVVNQPLSAQKMQVSGTPSMTAGGYNVYVGNGVNVFGYTLTLDVVALNTAPAITNLLGDSVAWAGVGNTIVLDAGGNAVISDAELGALNGGNGNWSGASLTLQRVGTAVAADEFGFNAAGASFTVSGNTLQSGGQTFATFTNNGGVLTITFDSSGTLPTNALVNDVVQRITYRNDTPAGDVQLRFRLDDGTASTTAEVTVTSDTIYVTSTADTATIDASDGVSLREAIAMAEADTTGWQTIVLAPNLANQTLTLAGDVAVNESLTLDLSHAPGVRLSGGTLTLGAGTTLTVSGMGIGNATIATSLAGAGSLAKNGMGTLMLEGAHTYIGGTSLNAGSLLVNGALASGVTAAAGTTLGGSGNISGNATVASGATLAPGQGMGAVGALTVNGNLVMGAGSMLAVDIFGPTPGTGYDQVVVNGAVNVGGAMLQANHGYTPGTGDRYTLIVNDVADAVIGTFNGLADGGVLNAVGNGARLTASYTGDTGNDFTLSAPVAPVVTSVSSSTANHLYKTGDVISIQVNFSQAVTVNGTPQLVLETGSTDQAANYASGSGTSMLTFNYTVQQGDTTADLDYIATNALTLNSGTIRGDGTNLDAILILPSPGATGSLGASKALVIDGVSPATNSITLSDAALRLGETATVTITFSEAVTGLTSADFSVANGTLSSLTSVDGGITWTTTLTPSPGISATNNVITLDNMGLTDLAGNTGTGTTNSANYAVDTLRPTATITLSSTSLAAGETATVTITFSEAVTGLALNDFSVASGMLSNLTSVDGGVTWTATLTPWPGISATNNVITLDNTGLIDSAGNTGTGTTDSSQYTIDVQVPAVSSVVVPANTTYIGGQSLDFTVNFNEAVIVDTSGGTPRIAISLDTGGIAYASYFAGSGSSALVFRLSVASGQSDSNGITVGSNIDMNGGTIKDAVGNLASTALNSVGWTAGVLIDAVAPSLDTAGSTPADDATNVPVTSSIVLAFSEALNPASDLTKVYLKDVATDTLVPASVSIDGSGKLVIAPTASLTAGAAYYVTWDANALRDAAGNAASALGDAVTYNFTTQAAPPSSPAQPTTPTVPAPVPVPVDGALVTIQTGADGTITTTIAPVTPGRVDDPNTPNTTLADVPLFQSGGNPLLLASLPVGFGLSASTPGLSTAGNSLTDLIRQILGYTAAGSQDQSQLSSGGAAFLSGLAPSTPLLVQTIVPTFQGSGTPGQALGIFGQPAAPGQPLTALVINASGLPSGTSLQLNNVEFAAIIGAVSVSGGAGSQHVWGDSTNQSILLGAEDDVLHGGGGNDTVGSLGGNDQVFGDAGNDIVFGGTGNDTLSGGTGSDRLDGGLGWDTALQSGALTDYTLRTEGQFLVMTHKTTGEVDRLKSIETIQFDSGANLYLADSDAEAALAHIVTTWLGRELTPAEGAWAQQHSGLSDLQVAQVLLNVSYAPQLQGHTAEELVAGWQGNPQIVRMHVASEQQQGTAGLDQLHLALQQAELYLERTGSDRWEGTSRIGGDMAEFLGIERLHLKDVSVALDTQGTAGQLAALLSVTLGSSALDNKGLVGEGLAALDAGMSVQALGDIALGLAQAQQGHTFTAQETVQWLWTKATGSAGTQQQLQPLVQQLQSGQISSGELANAAVQHALAHPSLQLLGVLEQSLVYTLV